MIYCFVEITNCKIILNRGKQCKGVNKLCVRIRALADLGSFRESVADKTNLFPEAKPSHRCNFNNV